MAQSSGDPTFLSGVAASSPEVQAYFQMLQQAMNPQNGAADALAGDGGYYNDPQGGSSTNPVAGAGSTPNYDAPGIFAVGPEGNPNFVEQPFKPKENPVFDPATDPTFAAFQRALNANEDSLRANVANKVSTARNAVAQQIPGLEEILRRRHEQIGLGAAQRGAWSSSGRLNEDNQADYDTAQTKGALQSGLADTEAGYQSDLANQLASGQRDLAEQQLAASGRLQAGFAQSEADRKDQLNASNANRYRQYLQYKGLG